eukprot:COSAG01_NODE_24246_length_785_cov_1.631195_2_plen_142_part_00
MCCFVLWFLARSVGLAESLLTRRLTRSRAAYYKWWLSPYSVERLSEAWSVRDRETAAMFRSPQRFSSCRPHLSRPPAGDTLALGCHTLVANVCFSRRNAHMRVGVPANITTLIARVEGKDRALSLGNSGTGSESSGTGSGR